MYWKGYSWSVLGPIAVVWVICLDHSPTTTFTWLAGLDIVLWIFGLFGLFSFAYGMPLFPSAFWKGIFWIFMVRQAIVMWVCTIPDVWNTWNTWVFIVAEIIFILIWLPMYLALYRMGYANESNQSEVFQ